MTATDQHTIPQHLVQRCSTCKARIIWLRNIGTGRAAPIDAEPDDKLGNIAVYPSSGTYRIVPKENRPYFDGQLHTNHFATCPYAAEHHKTTSTP